MTKPPIDQQVTFLYTNNLVESSHFYGEILGLPLALDQGKCHIYRVAATSFLGICERDAVPVDKSSIILTLVTQEVDRWYEYLKAKGVLFQKPPAHNPDYNIYHCFLRDPNGYLIEIQRFHDPAWNN
jgi:catechol 2,3-dioxygenase-like lactoylglutathione lyase family enzyme